MEINQKRMKLDNLGCRFFKITPHREGSRGKFCSLHACITDFYDQRLSKNYSEVHTLDKS